MSAALSAAAQTAGYAADLGVMVTYAHLARSGRPRAFHWANALGAIPLAAVEALARVWQPLVLTAFFGAIGWYGVLRTTTRQTWARWGLTALGLRHLADDEPGVYSAR